MLFICGFPLPNTLYGTKQALTGSWFSVNERVLVKAKEKFRKVNPLTGWILRANEVLRCFVLDHLCLASLLGTPTTGNSSRNLAAAPAMYDMPHFGPLTDPS